MTPVAAPRPLRVSDQFAGLVTCTSTAQMSDQIRVSLFDNRGASNEKAPMLTGRLEIPVEVIEQLHEYLLAQPSETYEDRVYVKLPISLWQFDRQPSKLKFVGSASLYRSEAAQEEEDEFLGQYVEDAAEATEATAEEATEAVPFS